MADPGENTFNIEGVVQSSFVSLTLLNTAENRMNAAQAERDSLDAEFKVLSTDQNEKLRQITELNKEISSLDRILTSSRQSLENLEKEKGNNEARRRDIDDLLDKLEEGDESIPGLVKEREDLEARHVVLIDLIHGLKDDIVEKEQLITDKETERAEATKISNTLANQIREVSPKLAIAETKLLEATQLYNGYKTTFDFQQSQIISIASVVDDPVNNLVNSIVNKGVSLNDQIKAKNNKISELTNKRNELIDKKNECERSQLNFDIASSLPETYNTWEIRFNNDLKAWNKLFELQIRGYNTQHGGVTPDNEAKDHIRNVYEAIGAELNSLYKEYAEQKEKYELMISQLNSLPGAIKTTEKNIARLDELISRYESALTTINDEIDSLKEKGPGLEDSKSFNEETISDTTKFIDSVSKDLEASKSKLETEESALVNTKNDETEKESEITTLITQITGFTTAISTLESEITALEKSNKDLSNEIETLNNEIKTLVTKREKEGLSDDETTELATKEASLETKKEQVDTNEKSLNAKSDTKSDREADLEVAKQEKETAEKSLQVIKDKIKDREATIVEIKGDITKMKGEIAKETSKRTTATNNLKSIDKELSALKANLLVLEEDKTKNEKLLSISQDNFEDERGKLEDQQEELKHLTDNDNEVIKEAKKEMETGLEQYTLKKEEKAEKQLKQWKSELEGNVKDKLELIETTDTLLVEANNMAKALLRFEDAQAFTSQVGTAISSMVNGSNEEENDAINEQREASDKLENPDGSKINISAAEANQKTQAEEFAMTVTGPYIKAQINKNPKIKFVKIPIDVFVSPKEIDTCIRKGFGISFENIETRKGDVFTEKLQMKIDWSVPLDTGKS